jgi:hypothetical protein
MDRQQRLKWAMRLWFAWGGVGGWGGGVVDGLDGVTLETRGRKKTRKKLTNFENVIIHFDAWVDIWFGESGHGYPNTWSW